MRVREANTRILRAKLQPYIDAMLSNLSLPCATSTDPPVPRRIELCAGRERKENAASTQGGTRFPDGSPGGKHVPESALRLGRSFRMAPQAETASRNRAVEWDMLSQWQLKRKAHPGIDARNGIHFPEDASSGKFIPESALRTGHAFLTAVQAESPSRNPASNWDVLSAPSPQLQNLCALHSKTG